MITATYHNMLNIVNKFFGGLGSKNLKTYDKIVKEARRKLDVNRMLVEDTRLVLTEEIRRQEFIKNIKNNSKK